MLKKIETLKFWRIFMKISTRLSILNAAMCNFVHHQATSRFNIARLITIFEHGKHIKNLIFISNVVKNSIFSNFSTSLFQAPAQITFKWIFEWYSHRRENFLFNFSSHTWKIFSSMPTTSHRLHRIDSIRDTCSRQKYLQFFHSTKSISTLGNFLFPTKSIQATYSMYH